MNFIIKNYYINLEYYCLVLLKTYFKQYKAVLDRKNAMKELDEVSRELDVSFI